MTLGKTFVPHSLYLPCAEQMQEDLQLIRLLLSGVNRSADAQAIIDDAPSLKGGALHNLPSKSVIAFGVVKSRRKTSQIDYAVCDLEHVCSVWCA